MSDKKAQGTIVGPTGQDTSGLAGEGRRSPKGSSNADIIEGKGYRAGMDIGRGTKKSSGMFQPTTYPTRQHF